MGLEIMGDRMNLDFDFLSVVFLWLVFECLYDLFLLLNY